MDEQPETETEAAVGQRPRAAAADAGTSSVQATEFSHHERIGMGQGVDKSVRLFSNGSRASEEVCLRDLLKVAGLPCNYLKRFKDRLEMRLQSSPPVTHLLHHARYEGGGPTLDVAGTEYAVKLLQCCVTENTEASKKDEILALVAELRVRARTQVRALVAVLSDQPPAECGFRPIMPQFDNAA